MKKQTKGIIAVVSFGSLLMFWAAAASVPSIIPPEPGMEITETGTPADNFPDAQRAQFCSSGDAKSNTYVTEFGIGDGRLLKLICSPICAASKNVILFPIKSLIII